MRLVTEMSNGTEVSTVLTPSGYETCLFFSDGSSQVVERYQFYKTALKGHAKWCAQLEGQVLT